MCGIVACLFKYYDPKNYMYLTKGLEELQNRGYDSVGVSVIHENTLMVRKKLQCHNFQHDVFDIKNLDNKNMIGHTRWATHGSVSTENTHPHVDTIIGKFSIVHNGIIENYDSLKTFLTSHDIEFRSDTDTEVLLNLIVFHYIHIQKYSDDEMRIEKAITKTISMVQGTYGVVLQILDHPDKLFCVRKGSPMIVGIDKKYEKIFVSSEKQAFPDFVERYIRLPVNKIIICRFDDAFFSNRFVNEGIACSRSASDSNDKFYQYHTEKEINDQKNLIHHVSKHGYRFVLQQRVRLDALDKISNDLRNIKNICFIGCGTSYHVCLILQYLYLQSGHFNQVLAFDASDFDIMYLPDDVFCGVFISQSGETLDLLNAHALFKEKHSMTLSIVNVIDSYLTTITSASVYTHIGKEKGVASTKSFTAQIITGIMILLWFIQSYSERVHYIIKDMNEFDSMMSPFMDQMFQYCSKQIIPVIKKYQNIFLMGRKLDYMIAKEGALKIKEIAYRFAEAYPSGALKHGPFALLDDKVLVIFLLTHASYQTKTMNNIEEVRARNANILLLSIFNDPGCGLHIKLPSHAFSYLFASVVLQIIAFQLSIESGINPDFPRNLAKVVTVE